jgi:DNA-binding MarR family transcriptional regulator
VDGYACDVEERFGLIVKRAEQALIAAKERALRPLGLTVPQFMAMYRLAEHPGAPAAELARQCFVSPQNMTTVVANLETKGLVERRRHPYHRTLVELRLTAQGRRLLQRADRATLAVEAQLVQGIDRDHLEIADAVLARCIENLARDRLAEAPPG